MAASFLSPSTRNPRLPAGCKASDIFRRVDIAVVPGSAIGTGPFPNPQRHDFLIATAVATRFACRLPAVYYHHLPPVPIRFVFNLPAEFAHADIGDSARKAVVFQHPGHVQVFQLNHVRAADNRRGGLVQEVGAHRRDVGVNLSNPASLLTAPVAAFLHPGQPALLALEVLQLALEMARIARLDGVVAIPTHHHVLDAQIQTDRLSGQGQCRNLDFTSKRHKVAALWRPADRRHFRDARRHLRPAHLERAQLWQLEEFAGLVGALNLALVQLIAHGLAVVPTFKFGIAGFLAGLDPTKEGVERLVLVNQALRQTTGRGIRQPWELTALPFRDLLIQRNVVVALFPFFPRFAALFQATIPHETSVAELNRQLLTLVSGRIEPEFVGFEFCAHGEYCTGFHSAIQEEFRHGQQTGNHHVSRIQ